MSDYCSSKFAAVGLHESLVEELRASKKTGIKTTIICPAAVNTGLFQGSYDYFFKSS
jgi:short-subunit dehydrogenase